jgi:hypothetical protein
MCSANKPAASRRRAVAPLALESRLCNPSCENRAAYERRPVCPASGRIILYSRKSPAIASRHPGPITSQAIQVAHRHMTGAEHPPDYDLLKCICDESIRSFHARDRAGRLVMVHFLDTGSNDEHRVVLSLIENLPPPDKGKILKTAEVEGWTSVVTELLEDFSGLDDWLRARSPSKQAAPPGQASPQTPKAAGSDAPGDFTRLFGTVDGPPSATPVPSHRSSPVPVEQTPSWPQPPTTAPEEPRGQSSAPDSGETAASGPGEFTRAFGAIGGAPAAPSADRDRSSSPPDSVPPRPASLQQQPPKAAAEEPQGQSSAPDSGEPAATGPGEFTRIFGAGGGLPAASAGQADGPSPAPPKPPPGGPVEPAVSRPSERAPRQPPPPQGGPPSRPKPVIRWKKDTPTDKIDGAKPVVTWKRGSPGKAVPRAEPPAPQPDYRTDGAKWPGEFAGLPGPPGAPPPPSPLTSRPEPPPHAAGGPPQGKPGGEFTQLFGSPGEVPPTPLDEPKLSPATPPSGASQLPPHSPGGPPRAKPLSRASGDYLQALQSTGATQEGTTPEMPPSPPVTPSPVVPPVPPPPSSAQSPLSAGPSEFTQIVSGVPSSMPPPPAAAPGPPQPSSGPGAGAPREQPPGPPPQGGGPSPRALLIGLTVVFVVALVWVVLFLLLT